MANVFGILTAVTLALAAFVAFKNQARYESVIEETKGKRADLTASEARLATAEEILAALPAEVAGVDAEVADLLSQETKQKKTNEEIKAQVDERTAKIASNKQQLDEIREKTQKTGDLKDLASKMRATSAELVELTESIANAQANLANLTAQHAASESAVASARGRFENYASGQSLPDMQTRIRSIYPSWGFVTLAGGNNVGVVANSTLNVIRNGQTIAMLVVTAVESNSASASIVPDSLDDDVTLMVGDQVVPGIKAPTASTAAAN
jgi:myosin heavy subunit